MDTKRYVLAGVLIGVLIVIPPVITLSVVLVLIVFSSIYYSKPISRREKKAYLKSEEWKTLRNRVLYRDDYKCQSCFGSQERLEVHHITYERLGKERLDDLVTLCRDCHQEIHDRLGYSHKGTYKVH